MKHLFNWQRRLLAVVLAGMLLLSTAACGSPSQASVGNSDLPSPEKTGQATPQPSALQPQKTSIDEETGPTPTLDKVDPQIDDSAVKDATPVRQADEYMRKSKYSTETPPVAKDAEEGLKNAGQSAKQAGKNAQRSVKNAGEEAKESAKEAGQRVKGAAQQAKEKAAEAGDRITD